MVASMKKANLMGYATDAFLEERKRLSDKAFKRIMRLCQKMQRLEA
jgi:chromate transport protein ChrA